MIETVSLCGAVGFLIAVIWLFIELQWPEACERFYACCAAVGRGIVWCAREVAHGCSELARAFARDAIEWADARFADSERRWPR